MTDGAEPQFVRAKTEADAPLRFRWKSTTESGVVLWIWHSTGFLRLVGCMISRLIDLFATRM